MAGLTPLTAAEVNNNVGVILRRLVDDRESIMHLQANLAPLDLQAPPYDMSPEDDTLIKSAVNGANSDLQAMEMTFINRLVGMW